jgi:hypothetical protein
MKKTQHVNRSLQSLLLGTLGLLILVGTLNSRAFSKDKFVVYDTPASQATVRTTLLRYFTQAGYVEDKQRTKQCSLDPKPSVLIFRQTGAAQSGIGGLSRCLMVTFSDGERVTRLRIEVTDHLRGGLSLPATKHYDADWIHREYDSAFAEIVRLSEGT